MIWHMDPIIKARKKFIYLRKELNLLGYDSMEEVPLEIREHLEKMLQENMNPNERAE